LSSGSNSQVDGRVEGRTPTPSRPPGRGQPRASEIGSLISGGLACGDGGAVGEGDHRVHDGLRVHHHVDSLVGHTEQQVRLDEFKPLFTRDAEFSVFIGPMSQVG
jgi:hypothetical protein